MSRIRPIRACLGLLLALIAFPVCGPIALLLLTSLAFTAESIRGRLLGLLAIDSVVALIALVGLIAGGPRGILLGLSVGTILMGGVIFARLVRMEPYGDAAKTVGLTSFWSTASRSGRDEILGQIPQGDLIRLAARWLTPFVPGMDRKRRLRVRTVTRRLDRELRSDPRGGGLESVIHQAVGGLILGDRSRGHCYAYIPECQRDERLGLLVFLHGNGGNASMMAWNLRPLAERQRVAVLMPTFGFGFWGEGATEVVSRSIDDMIARVPIDSNRIYLGGLSDGGNGVTRAGGELAKRLAGLVYVSPTMRIKELTAPNFAREWRDRPVIVLHGESDIAVQVKDVDAAVLALRELKVEVTYHRFEGEDHFLLFGQRDECVERIVAWLQKVEAARCDQGRDAEATKTMQTGEGTATELPTG